MKRSAALVLLLVSGCSTAPFADLGDFFWPGTLRPPQTAPYGGVCVPQPLAPPAGVTPVAPAPCPPPASAPAPAAVPPPPAAVPPPSPVAPPAGL
jgi:hypothetical protein